MTMRGVCATTSPGQEGVFYRAADFPSSGLGGGLGLGGRWGAEKCPQKELYLVTLSRPPRPGEVTRALGWIREAPTPREGVQDLLWVLLNSREFLFIR
jgi:hypothetical protein